MADGFACNIFIAPVRLQTPVFLPLVPPPGGGLGSNSNYFIDSNCDDLLNLTVSILVTEDLVWQSSDGDGKGFSFQLNANSPIGAEAAWLQYALILADDEQGNHQLSAATEYWRRSLDKPLFNVPVPLTTIPKLAIPAGYLLEIRLENAENKTVRAVNVRMVNVGVVPAPRSNIHSYVGSDGEQHVDFIGADGHVRELFYRPGEGWVNHSLTQLAGSTVLPSGDSSLAGYARTDGDQHVFYIGRDGHVHEFHIEPGGSWLDNDLIVASGNDVGASTISALDAYAGSDRSQHVNFIGADGHVRELYLAHGKQWVNNDLTHLSRSRTTPMPGTNLDGYWGDQSGQHVNYIARDGHVHELYIYPGAQWIDNDLILLSKTRVVPMPGTPLSGYAGVDRSQHVNFVGGDGHVYELLTRPHEDWVMNDLTHLAGDGVIPGPGSSLHSYWGPDDGQHVNFIGADGHVRELYIPSDGQWVNNDLTQLSRSTVVPAAQSTLAGFWGDGDSQHVHYISSDGHLHELYIPSDGEWEDNDLNFIVQKCHKQDLTGEPEAWLPPITAFQLNIVGPFNAESTVFSSGAGTITYTASSPLTALTDEPACTAVFSITAETANTVYGQMIDGAHDVLVQTFALTQAARMIRKKGPGPKHGSARV